MHYNIPCACGESVTVAETAAGTMITCGCGRIVVVPSLRELLPGGVRTAPPPELALETLLAAGKLPEETHCLLCGAATDGVVCCKAECERALVLDGQPPIWARILAFVAFGWLGLLAASVGHRREGIEWRKERVYTLPLRICDACRPESTSPEAIQRALGRVPLYRRLLEKYPDTRISMLDS